MYSVSSIQRKLALMLADLVQLDTSPGLADRVYGSLLDAISDGPLAPGRGLLVAPLDLTLLAQVYVVRGALDSSAARLSAQGKAVLDARLIERGRKASAGRSVKAMIEADLAFHQAIYAASGDTLLDQAAQLHWRWGFRRSRTLNPG